MSWFSWGPVRWSAEVSLSFSFVPEPRTFSGVFDVDALSTVGYWVCRRVSTVRDHTPLDGLVEPRLSRSFG